MEMGLPGIMGGIYRRIGISAQVFQEKKLGLVIRYAPRDVHEYRLVDVQGMTARRIKAGQPHIAHNHQLHRIIRILKALFQAPYKYGTRMILINLLVTGINTDFNIKIFIPAHTKYFCIFFCIVSNIIYHMYRDLPD
jgi:hypothetical protein